MNTRDIHWDENPRYRRLLQSWLYFIRWETTHSHPNHEDLEIVAQPLRLLLPDHHQHLLLDLLKDTPITAEKLDKYSEAMLYKVTPTTLTLQPKTTASPYFTEVHDLRTFDISIISNHSPVRNQLDI